MKMLQVIGRFMHKYLDGEQAICLTVQRCKIGIGNDGRTIKIGAGKDIIRGSMI